jgi:hypothetical protein
MNVEDWARPARGRIVIMANPPRRHEEYAIISIDPPPPANQIYKAINEVLEYFEDEHRVRFHSCCPSPLGLCLAQFSFGHCSTVHDQLESASFWKWHSVEGGGA